jgi:GT2 family glycosyltransferase
MTAFHGAKPDIGALGVKLLFEDDSLQHAGMYFARVPGTGEFETPHYFKGMQRLLPGATVARRVPAVTDACLMIAADVYGAVGGLSGTYIDGDFEAADLCLRLAKAGRENWYFPDAELYHLEGQSSPSDPPARVARYNRWLHAHLWGSQIEKTMMKFDSQPRSAQGSAHAARD